MSFSPHFLVILRHVLSSLFFIGQLKVFSVACNLQLKLLCYSTVESTQRSSGHSCGWWGQWDYLIKPFPEETYVSFAFMKYTRNKMSQTKPWPNSSVLLELLPCYKADFFILLVSFLSAGGKLSSVSDLGAEIPYTPRWGGNKALLSS